jgi:hypothetical protein
MGNEVKNQIELFPINEVRLSTEQAGNIFGEEYLDCDGSPVSKWEYPDLKLPTDPEDVDMLILPTVENGWIKAYDPNRTVFVFVEDTTWVVPKGVTEIEVFAVGGGGAGKNAFYLTPYSRNGGNGGQVIYQNVQVTPGQVIQITIGQGGAVSSGTNYPANPGGDTMFGNLITAQGGLAGAWVNTPEANHNNERVNGSARGGADSANTEDPDYNPNGEDGTLLPFDIPDYPELNGQYFGAAGGAGNQLNGVYTGGKTGGGDGAYYTPRTHAKSGTFYGAAGGGGMGVRYQNVDYTTAGGGYQGILILKLNRQ